MNNINNDDIKVLRETIEYDKDAWLNNPDPDFLEICHKSRVQGSWMSYQRVLEGKYSDSIIKPLSNYASVLIPPPKLISIIGNQVTLRFYTFADIYLQWRDNEFYNVDRPWIRQYYTTKFNFDVGPGVYYKTYKFYTPWFIDSSVEVRYSQVTDEYSAFVIHQTFDMWHEVPKNQGMAYPHFVPFNFKTLGDHMRDESYGVIEQPHPMFDMSFVAHGIMLEKIKEFYAKN